MSQEIRVSANVAVTNGNYTDQFVKNVSIDQATASGTKPTIALTTSDTALTFSGISTNGYAVFYNTDSVNYCKVGPESAGAIVPMLRINPGEFAVLRLEPGVVIRAQAHTSTIHLMAWVLEN